MKKFITLQDAVAKVENGMTLMIGGFLATGSPLKIIDQLANSGVKDLTVICNDPSYIDKGIGKLVANKQVKKLITSYIGSNSAAIDQLNSKELEIEFCPQGTLAERVRAGGSGLGGVLTPTGLGTIAAEGKQVLNVDGKDYLLEKPLRADVALIGASISDKIGNLLFKGTTRNFNSIMAMAADLVIVEPETVVETGSIKPEEVHSPAIFVDYIVQ